MGHAQQLRDLLAPLGVYRWEGTFQWGSCRARGRPWIRWRRNWKTPSRRCTWLPPRERGWTGFCPSGPGAGGGVRGGPAGHRRCPAADWRRQLHPGGHERHPSGCGLPARVEETGDPLKLKVIFPQAAGIPAGFAQVQARVEDILPCHVQVEYQFGEAE